jgi:hypothetical protein
MSIYTMATVTVHVSQELKDYMNSMPNIKWSNVFRMGITRKLDQLRKLEKLEREGKI